MTRPNETRSPLLGKQDHMEDQMPRMGTTEALWRVFEDTIVFTLQHLDRLEFLIFPVGDNFVQLIVESNGALLAEMSSPTGTHGRAPLTARQRARIGELGWERPRPTSESGNYEMYWVAASHASATRNIQGIALGHQDLVDVAQTVSRTLREGLGANTPDDVDVKGGTSSTDTWQKAVKRETEDSQYEAIRQVNPDVPLTTSERRVLLAAIDQAHESQRQQMQNEWDSDQGFWAKVRAVTQGGNILLNMGAYDEVRNILRQDENPTFGPEQRQFLLSALDAYAPIARATDQAAIAGARAKLEY